MPVTNTLIAANLTIVSLFQLFWTPDIIIHDLVSFNKPEILNQAISLVGAEGSKSDHWSARGLEEILIGRYTGPGRKGCLVVGAGPC